jgi:hypothetical protein
MRPENFDHSSEHFFTPIISSDTHINGHSDPNPVKSTGRRPSPRTSQEYHQHASKTLLDPTPRDQEEHKTMDVKDLQQRNPKSSSKSHGTNGFISKTGAISVSEAKAEKGSEDLGGELVRPFSPPLLTDLSSFTEGYDDLLGMSTY